MKRVNFDVFLRIVGEIRVKKSNSDCNLGHHLNKSRGISRAKNSYR